MNIWSERELSIVNVAFPRIPTVQFGTYKLKGAESFQATLSALQHGYKGIDTATCYDNEKQVRHCIQRNGRELLFKLLFKKRN